MSKRQSLIRLVGALAFAAACAAALDAVVVLADDAPATQPAMAAAPATRPTTGPALVGGTISSGFAQPGGSTAQTATLQSTGNGGGSVTDAAASVHVGNGIDPVQQRTGPVENVTGTSAGNASTHPSQTNNH